MSSGVTNTDSNAFDYQSLRDEGSFRLARFFRTGSELRCQLEHVSMSQKPEYHALSYVWRWRPQSYDSESINKDLEVTKPIFVDGKKVEVGANLTDFIDTITQLWDSVPPFWIDALCINQADDV